jgi:hypothetical protein
VPLRDHFRPPISRHSSWEGFHGMWPAAIVQHLRKRLPPGYIAEPRVHLGSVFEIDVSAFESEAVPLAGRSGGDGGVATMTWAPAEPSLAVETTIPDQYEYEVRVYDLSRGRQLVAAVEIVSPANKDRPESRNLFVAKCAALLQKHVAVSVVDLVTIRPFNLYAELLALVGQSDPTLGEPAPPLYAASCRWVERGKRKVLEAWSHTLSVGQPLPTLPLWLSEDRYVPLDLESSYEQACTDLWIS